MMNLMSHTFQGMHYRAVGGGFPVMLVHGFGETSEIWKEQIPELSTFCQLIIPDLPGCASSEMNAELTNLDSVADLIKRLAEEEFGNKKFTLIGHSMGGYIAMAFAKKYPDALRSLGMFHSSAFADDDAKIEVRKKNIEFISAHGSSAYAHLSVPNLFSEASRKEKPAIVKELEQLCASIPAEVLIQYTQAMMNRADTREVLTNLDCPVLFMIGYHDQAVPLKRSLEQCHLPKSSTVHILKNSGHIGMWEEKDLANFYLIQFLKEVNSSRY